MRKIEINNKEYDMSSPTTDEFKKKYIESLGDSFSEIPKVNLKVVDNSVDGYFLEVTTDVGSPFQVEVFDGEGVLIYTDELSSGMYCKLNRSYYTKWKTKFHLENLTLESNFNLENSRVFIVFESSSLGDTIAWVPYCEEFRKKHNCHVIVSTFRNEMFEKLYPNLEFVGRGVSVNNIKALYRLGWFYDKDKEPVPPSTIPLQKAATNILGLDYREIHSKIYFEPKKDHIPKDTFASLLVQLLDVSYGTIRQVG
jgi:autotransporter strand-loop-strand O-heptosyltransferase